MRRAKWMGLLALAVLLVACQSAAEPTQALPTTSAGTGARKVDVPKSAGEVPRMELAELKSLIDKGSRVVIVDTRDRTSYDRSHIPGAGQMPAEELEMRYRELPKGPPIVLYCA